MRLKSHPPTYKHRVRQTPSLRGPPGVLEVLPANISTTLMNNSNEPTTFSGFLLSWKMVLRQPYSMNYVYYRVFNLTTFMHILVFFYLTVIAGV